MDISHFVFTSDERWNLQTIDFRQMERKNEYDSDMNFKIRHIGKLGLATEPIKKTTHDEYDGIWDNNGDSYVEKRFIPKMISVVREEPETQHEDGSAETLARNLNIELETASRTMEMTTQQGICTAAHPIHKRYRIDKMNLHRRRLPGLALYSQRRSAYKATYVHRILRMTAM